ncbi:MFS transporter [Brevundimonas staleyi]|uniref:MFS transporter n=1 Tax=Brevundimonas staleyi TaxID=74326 RepID=A0ABW0FTP0_9CAUL
MTTVDVADDAVPPTAFRKTKWSVVWLLTLTIFSALTVGGLLAPIQEAVKLDLGLSDFQLAMIVGSATAIPAAILSLPIAWMVDHHTRTRLLIILASFWVVGTIGTAFAQDFYSLFAARLIAGVGAATAFPVLVSILADVCMPERRGRSMLLISIGAWAGVAAAFAIGGTLFGWLEANPTALVPDMPPWREVHLIVGIGAALLVLPLFLIREPARHEVEQANPPMKVALKSFWKRRAFLGWLYVGNFAGGFAEGAAALWIGSVLVRQYDQSPGEFGGWVGLVILASGVVGSIIGGFTADASQKLKMRGAILLPALIATALSIPASAYPIMPNVTLFAWVLFALLLGGTIVNLVNSAAIAVLLPNEERATSLAALAIIAKIVGGPVTAAVVAWMTLLFKGPMGLGLTLTWLGVVTGVISLIGYFLAMRYAPPPAAQVLPDAAVETA